MNSLGIRKNRFSGLLALCCLLLGVTACVRMPAPRADHPLLVVRDVETYRGEIRLDPDLELCDLEALIPGLILDIRYATANNFTGEVIYTAPKAYLRKPVAQALSRVCEDLKTRGLGVKVFDAYRPYAATVRFYEVYPNTDFVADPKDGSRHNRGCAVDLTLVDLATGLELEMPTPFDDFSPRAHSRFMALSPEVLANRTQLYEVMARYGFRVIDTEWWHFDYAGWERYTLLDLSFGQLEMEKKCEAVVF
jgi:D-alanyl-D-alanine dipeptidase